MDQGVVVPGEGGDGVGGLVLAAGRGGELLEVRDRVCGQEHAADVDVGRRLRVPVRLLDDVVEQLMAVRGGACLEDAVAVRLVAGDRGGGEGGGRSGRAAGGGEVSQVRAAVVAQEQVVSGDQEEVVAADEVGGEDRRERGAVPAGVARLLDEGEAGLLVEARDWLVPVRLAAGGEVRGEAAVFGEVVPDLAAGLAGGGDDRDLVCPGGCAVGDGVAEDWLVQHRQHALADRLGDGIEAGSHAGDGYDCLHHVVTPSDGSVRPRGVTRLARSSV